MKTILIITGDEAREMGIWNELAEALNLDKDPYYSNDDSTFEIDIEKAFINGVLKGIYEYFKNKT